VDAALLWTAVGSVAGVATVVVGVTVPVIQARSERRRRALTAPNVVRVSVEPPGTPGGKAAVAGTVLRAPTGRLPDQVRGRDDLLARLGSLVTKPDGRAHLLAGQYEQAEREYRDVLAARLPVLGPDHPHTLGTRHRSPGRWQRRAGTSRPNSNTIRSWPPSRWH
jgi:hypothetical protein